MGSVCPGSQGLAHSDGSGSCGFLGTSKGAGRKGWPLLGKIAGPPWARTPADSRATLWGWTTWDPGVGIVIIAIPTFLGNVGPTDGVLNKTGTGADVPQVRQEDEEQVRVQY